ncbi:MAG: hypothetical protein IJL91_11835 [Bacteroidales bacterium]|nr:hypothetical protein [Bacteroidales bacterium]
MIHPKDLSTVSVEQIVEESVKQIRRYRERLSYGDDFDEGQCYHECMLWLIHSYTVSYNFLTSPRSRDVEFKKLFLQASQNIKGKIGIERLDFSKESAAIKVMLTGVSAVFRPLFREKGLDMKAEGQKHRAKLTVTLQDKASVSFYFKYDDIQDEALVMERVKAVIDMADALSRLGKGASFVKE